MDFFFADDAQQNKPTRPGIGPLIAVGGIYIPDVAIRDLESQLDILCTNSGFPGNEIFKWSPRKDSWMYATLKGKAREEFFTKALELARSHSAVAIVIIEDLNSRMATKARSREVDLIQLLLERVHYQLIRQGCYGTIIVAQPSGGREMESKFLAECVDTLKCGTDYVKPDRIALSVILSQPRFIRLLQLADVVTSCTTAYVAGERRFSPSIFEVIKPMFAKDLGRIGGVGLKIHPDLKYANLYHWLVGDTTFWKHSTGYPLPWPGVQYSSGADKP